MNRVADWTSHHLTTQTEVQDILQSLSANALISKPTHWPFSRAADKAQIDQTDFLTTKLKPAFFKALGINEELSNVGVLRLSESHEKLPHARFSEQDHHVSIYLDWHGTPADAVCLAHEMGHAAHYLMSTTSSIPQIARETCAFLGELIVLDHLYETEDALFDPLHLIWDRENQTYLGSDLENLQEALGTPDATYTYRWNYPLARLAAVEMFQAYKAGNTQLIDMFKSGAESMSKLPLGEMAAKADQIQNYLPPFQTAPEPATSAYQSLGAMALLDIDTFEGPSERLIGDVYAELLENLQHQSAFIGLRDDARPIGYATWQSKPDDNELTITHQSAPFGDHLKLLRMLQHRFAKAGSVSAISQRSACKEQLAW